MSQYEIQAGQHTRYSSHFNSCGSVASGKSALSPKAYLLSSLNKDIKGSKGNKSKGDLSLLGNTSSVKTLKKTSNVTHDSFSTTFQNFKNRDTISRGSSEYGNVSTRPCTTTSLSKFRVRKIQTPKSLSTLPDDTTGQGFLNKIQGFCNTVENGNAMNSDQEMMYFTEPTYRENAVARLETLNNLERPCSIEMESMNNLGETIFDTLPRLEDRSPMKSGSIQKGKEFREVIKELEFNRDMSESKVLFGLQKPLREKGKNVKGKENLSVKDITESNKMIKCKCAKHGNGEDIRDSRCKLKKKVNLVVLKKEDKGNTSISKGRSLLLREQELVMKIKNSKQGVKTETEEKADLEYKTGNEYNKNDAREETLASSYKEGQNLENPASLESNKKAVARHKKTKDSWFYKLDASCDKEVSEDKFEGKDDDAIIMIRMPQNLGRKLSTKPFSMNDIKDQSDIQRNDLELMLDATIQDIEADSPGEDNISSSELRHEAEIEEAKEDSQKIQLEEDQVFKKVGAGFFDWNLNNKFLKEYGLFNHADLKYGRVGPNFKRPSTAITGDGKERVRAESENPWRKKRTDTSTVIVRYFDEHDPIVIQPKFMGIVGSMCVTELWGQKNKAKFYKDARNELNSNTFVSLEDHHGIYRPEKTIDSDALRRRRIANAGITSEVPPKVKVSADSFLKPGFFFSRSKAARHTRAFVLQGTNAARPQTSMARTSFKKSLF